MYIKIEARYFLIRLLNRHHDIIVFKDIYVKGTCSRVWPIYLFIIIILHEMFIELDGIYLFIIIILHEMFIELDGIYKRS